MSANSHDLLHAAYERNATLNLMVRAYLSAGDRVALLHSATEFSDPETGAGTLASD